MSDYFKSLDPIALKTYLEKLHLLDLGESDDPYAERNHEKFEDDMTRWPAVEYGHTFCYFIERPGLYTRRHFMQRESVDANRFPELAETLVCTHLGNIVLVVNDDTRWPSAAEMVLLWGVADRLSPCLRTNSATLMPKKYSKDSIWALTPITRVLTSGCVLPSSTNSQSSCNTE